MHTLVPALMLTLLLPAGLDTATERPSCSAEARGRQVVTTLELPYGMRFEAPWRVSYSGRKTDDGIRFTMHARLDRVIEEDLMTGTRGVVPLPHVVQLELTGATHNALIYRTAQVWCVTMMRAQQNRALYAEPPVRAPRSRIAHATDHAAAARAGSGAA